MAWGDRLLEDLKRRGEAQRRLVVGSTGRVVSAPPPPVVVDQRPELSLPFSGTIYGGPRTKKNSLRRRSKRGEDGVVRKLTIPSKAFLVWQDLVTPQLVRLRGPTRPIQGEVSVRALIYRDAAYHGDLAGYIQAIGDALQHAGVLVDDELIQSWDGTRRLLDRELPRVEITIEAFHGCP